MANTKSASKRARQTVKRTARNTAVHSSIRTQLKHLRAAIADGNKETAGTRFKTTISAIDRAVKSGQVHGNTAARHKQRLSKAITAIA